MRSTHRLRVLGYTGKSAGRGQVIQTIQNHLRRVVYTRDYWERYGKNSFTFTFPEWVEHGVAKWRVTLHNPYIQFDTQDWDKFMGLNEFLSDRDEEKKSLAGMIKILKPLGWFVKAVKKVGIWHHILLEPVKYEEEDIPEYLYHFSSVWNKDRILRKGLIPSKGDWGTDYMYPPRVHVLTEFKVNDIKTLAFHMSIHDNPEDAYSGDAEMMPIVIFRIDTDALNPGTKFRKDRDADNALWTYTHIPRQALTVVYEDKDPL